MGSYSVEVTKQAKEQMHDISLYIARELKNREAALDLLDSFENAMASLSENPERIVLVKEEPWRSNGVRQMIVENYFLYFWIDEAMMKVYVTMVVYQRREQKNQLGNMIFK